MSRSIQPPEYHTSQLASVSVRCDNEEGQRQPRPAEQPVFLGDDSFHGQAVAGAIGAQHEEAR